MRDERWRLMTNAMILQDVDSLGLCVVETHTAQATIRCVPEMNPAISVHVCVEKVTLSALTALTLLATVWKVGIDDCFCTLAIIN